MAKRPAKHIRLNYLLNDPNRKMAMISVLGDPAEVRFKASEDQFISINELTGVTLSPGLGKQVNLQAMSHNMTYGGMLMDLPFPMSIMPITPFTPFPTQVFRPPLLGLMPTLVQMSSLLALLPA